ncbi:MAG TPA: hypothetical protein VMH87_00655 [Pseudomonadales bacterium]|nr:hypothetical protein [Pseudomonadales bacterium]
MKLKFGIDQEACFKSGNNYSETTATIDIDPSMLSQEQRDLIAPRLNGDSVVPLTRFGGSYIQDTRYFILADGPNLQDLLDACANNEAEIKNPNDSTVLDASRKLVPLS